MSAEVIDMVTGEATIKRAIEAGDLRESHPLIDGRPSSTGVIVHAELERWVVSAA